MHHDTVTAHRADNFDRYANAFQRRNSAVLFAWVDHTMDLTRGDAYGQGETMARELFKRGMLLGCGALPLALVDFVAAIPDQGFARRAWEGATAVYNRANQGERFP